MIKRDRKKLAAWRARSRGLKRGKALAPGNGLGRGKARLRSRPQPTTGIRVWVRETWVCCVPGCGRRRPDPHHVVAKGAGRRDPDKVDRENLAPLCRTHHRLGDSPGWSWARFQEELGVDLEAVRKAVWAAWEALPAAERKKWETKARRINLQNGAVRLR